MHATFLKGFKGTGGCIPLCKDGGSLTVPLM